MPIDIYYAKETDQCLYGTGTSRANAGNAVDGTAIHSTGLHLVGVWRRDTSLYEYYQADLDFDISALTGTVQSGLIGWVNASGVSATVTIEASVFSWTGGNSSTFRKRTQLGSLSQIAVGSVASGTGARSIPLTSLSLSPTSSFKIVLHTQDQRTGSGISNPAVGASTTAQFYRANTSGTTNDPYLSITTVTETPEPVAINTTAAFSSAVSLGCRRGAGIASSSIFNADISLGRYRPLSAATSFSFAGILTFATPVAVGLSGGIDFNATVNVIRLRSVSIDASIDFSLNGSLVTDLLLGLPGALAFGSSVGLAVRFIGPAIADPRRTVTPSEPARVVALAEDRSVATAFENRIIGVTTSPRQLDSTED